MLRAAKKQDKPTTFWLAYQARTNVADVELAAVLDRRIDLVPSLSFLWFSVVCQVVHMGVRSPDTYNVSTAPSPLDQPLVILQLTSFPLPKNHIPQTVGYFPRNVDSSEPVPSHVHTPQSTLIQIRVDVPIDITREVDGVKVKSHISGSLPLMLMQNGLNPDDTPTVLKELTIPRITKTFWPVIVNSAPEGYNIFDFFVPFDVLGNLYDEQPALMDIGVSIGLLDKSVKESPLVITNQPRFQKGGPRRRKLSAYEVRTAIEMNPALYRKFAFLVLLNRYDVLGMVHDPMLIQPAVQEIENLGEMICVSAHTNNRVFAKDSSREVNPPYYIVRFPPTIDIRDVVKSAATFGPVDGQQIFQQSGLVMIKYQTHQSALTSYGATLPGPVYFTSGSSEKDVQISITNRLEQVRLASLPSPRLNEANLAAASHRLVHSQSLTFTPPPFHPLPPLPPLLGPPPLHFFLSHDWDTLTTCLWSYGPTDDANTQQTPTPTDVHVSNTSGLHHDTPCEILRSDLMCFLELRDTPPTPKAFTAPTLRNLPSSHSFLMHAFHNWSAICVGTYRLVNALRAAACYATLQLVLRLLYIPDALRTAPISHDTRVSPLCGSPHSAPRHPPTLPHSTSALRTTLPQPTPLLQPGPPLETCTSLPSPTNAIPSQAGPVIDTTDNNSHVTQTVHSATPPQSIPAPRLLDKTASTPSSPPPPVLNTTKYTR